MSDVPRFPHEKALAIARALDDANIPHAFGGAIAIRVPSAEDLAIFKVLFDRPKDWADVEAILLTRGERFDASYVHRWVAAVVGDDDPRTAKLRALLQMRESRSS